MSTERRSNQGPPGRDGQEPSLIYQSVSGGNMSIPLISACFSYVVFSFYHRSVLFLLNISLYLACPPLLISSLRLHPFPIFPFCNDQYNYFVVFIFCLPHFFGFLTPSKNITFVTYFPFFIIPSFHPLHKNKVSFHPLVSKIVHFFQLSHFEFLLVNNNSVDFAI